MKFIILFLICSVCLAEPTYIKPTCKVYSEKPDADGIHVDVVYRIWHKDGVRTLSEVILFKKPIDRQLEEKVRLWFLADTLAEKIGQGYMEDN